MNPLCNGNSSKTFERGMGISLLSDTIFKRNLLEGCSDKIDVQKLTGCSTYYQIDHYGTITSLHKRNPGKIISKRIDRAGYYSVRLSMDGITKTFLLHRLLAQSFIPNPENKQYVNHINGNRLDCRICNLEWSTFSENMQHAFSTGLCKAPEKNSKRVVDVATGKIFKSVMQAAKAKGIAYSTCKNYLRGRRKNKTTLMLAGNLEIANN